MTRYFGMTVLVLFLSGCNALGGGPESAARTEFEKWAKNNGVPYQNVQVSAKIEEPFAKVKVTAEFKQNLDAPWVEQEAAVDCRKVGQEWQCGKNFYFNKTARFIASENATAQAKAGVSTATAQAQAVAATATAQTKVAAATATWTSLGVPKERATDGVPMMFVPAGEFLMGSNDADRQATGDEKPQHTIYLDAFWIDKYEVTNALYKKCADTGKCSRPSETTSSTRSSYYGNSQFVNYPVIHVSWNDANTYCQWAGKRLPTEAEWEIAARGIDGRIYPWGNGFDRNRLNSSESGRGDTAEVGSFPSGASPYGTLDIAGNVREWVTDWYDGNYYMNSPNRNPQGPSSGQHMALRGGSWNVNQYSVRAADRDYYMPTYSLNYVGFRCAQ